MIRNILTLLTAGALFIQSFVFMSNYWWFFELFSHYPHYYAVAFTILAVMLIRKRMWIFALIVLILVSINTAELNSYINTQESTANADISILSNNVFYKSTEFDGLRNVINTENPDIFVIHEASAAWEKELNTYKPSHPNQSITTKTGVHGIAIASKIPGRFNEIPIGSEVGLEFIPRDSSFVLLAVHPTAPITEDLAIERNKQFYSIMSYIKDQSLPVIVIGDFNCTPFSPHFKELLSNTGLRDSRVGFGLINTWHANNFLFKIPIDHALVSEEINVADFHTTEKTEADHLPIVVSLDLP